MLRDDTIALTRSTRPELSFIALQEILEEILGRNKLGRKSLGHKSLGRKSLGHKSFPQIIST